MPHLNPAAEEVTNSSARSVAIDIGYTFSQATLGSSVDKNQILRHLAIRSHAFAHKPDGQIDVQESSRIFGESNGDSTISLPTGCVRFLVKVLERDGIQVRSKDHRHFEGPAFQVSELLLSQLTPFDRQVAEAIIREPLGQIAASRPGDKQRWLALIPRLFPKSHVLIPLPNVAAAREWADILSNQLREKVDAVSKGTWGSPQRVVCCTLSSFDTCQRSDWDIVVFPDAIGSLGRKTWSNWMNPNPHRVYGFVDPQQRQSPGQQMRLFTLTGPIIVGAPNASPTQPQAVVLAATSPVTDRFDRCGALERKQKLWNSDIRNQFIAEIANAFAVSKIEKLWAAGIMLDAPSLPSNFPKRPTVMILVESVEHGRAISKVLPEWTLLHGIADNLSVQKSKAMSWGDWVLPPRSIVTAVRADQLKNAVADVLILAAGGERPLLPKGILRGLSGRPGQTHQTLIVDVADDFDHMAKTSTKKRLQTYSELGFSRLVIQGHDR